MTTNTTTMTAVPACLGDFKTTPAAGEMCERMIAQVHVHPVRGHAVLTIKGWLELIADAGHGPADVDYDVEDDLVIGARVRVVLADGGVFEHEVTREDVERRGAKSAPRLWAEHRDLIVRGFAIKEAAKAMARDGYINAASSPGPTKPAR